MNHQFSRIALIALFAGTLATGFSPIFVRFSEVDPAATGFWRLGLALPVLWVWSFLEMRERGQRPNISDKPGNARRYRWLILTGLFFAADVTLFNWSLEFTSVANASLLANSAPIFVVLGAWLFLGERFNSIFVTGLGLALAGAAVLVGASYSLGMQYLLGDSLALLTALFYAGYILSIKHLRRSFSTAVAMGGSGLISCLMLLALGLLTGERLLALTAQGWLVLVGFALVSHVGGQGMITYALAHLPASFSSVSLLLQPAMATALAWLLLQEPVGLWQGLGGLIVLSGIYLARLGSR